MTSWGPLETHRQAIELPTVQEIYATFRELRGDAIKGGMDAPNLRMLEDACEAAKLRVGAYERLTLRWLSKLAPETCAVFAALIRRAFDAGRASR